MTIASEPSDTTALTANESRIARDYVILLLKGFAIGSGNVVPGVSGGTMAFILGVFEELIESIRKAAKPEFIRAVLSLRWREALEIINARFLAAIGFGAVLAVLTLARVLEWLLIHKAVLVWSFFFGLILASVVVVGRRISRWGATTIFGILAGAVGAWVLVGFVPVSTPDTWWFLAFSGALAMCAMILPGVSGAFVLVLLGKYQTILGALNRGEFNVIAIVGIGAVVGIVVFSQALGWLFKHYHDLTVAILTGFMLGSLRKVWPWKEPIPAGEGLHSIAANVMPSLMVNGVFQQEFVWACVLALIGLGVVLLMDRATAISSG